MKQMIDEILIKEITNIGLTSKQAKVYASVITKGSTSIPEISRRTGLHEQDIYKIVRNLEKMGLVTRTTFKPIRVDEISIENALDNFINLQQRKIESQKKSIKEIVKIIQSKQEPRNQWEDQRFTLIQEKSEALANSVKLVFESIRKTYDCFVPLDVFLKFSLPIFLEKFRIFALHNVKSRILVSKTGSDELVRILAETKLPQCDVIFKSYCGDAFSYFAIIDNREVWIPTDLKRQGPVLVTDAPAVVNLSLDCFESYWNFDKSKIASK